MTGVAAGECERREGENHQEPRWRSSMRRRQIVRRASARSASGLGDVTHQLPLSRRHALWAADRRLITQPRATIGRRAQRFQKEAPKPLFAAAASRVVRRGLLEQSAILRRCGFAGASNGGGDARRATSTCYLPAGYHTEPCAPANAAGRAEARCAAWHSGTGARRGEGTRAGRDSRGLPSGSSPRSLAGPRCPPSPQGHGARPTAPPSERITICSTIRAVERPECKDPSGALNPPRARQCVFARRVERRAAPPGSAASRGNRCVSPHRWSTSRTGSSTHGR